MHLSGCLIGKTSKMKKFNAAALLLAGLVALALVAAPLAASAKVWDKPNSGICKSGKQIGNIKHCKENGGKW
jgi:hypothetical protein